jgi:hypothetical protein
MSSGYEPSARKEFLCAQVRLASSRNLGYTPEVACCKRQLTRLQTSNAGVKYPVSPYAMRASCV